VVKYQEDLERLRGAGSRELVARAVRNDVVRTGSSNDAHGPAVEGSR